jgi:hypothetical protein
MLGVRRVERLALQRGAGTQSGFSLATSTPHSGGRRGSHYCRHQAERRYHPDAAVVEPAVKRAGKVGRARGGRDRRTSG